MGDMQQYRAHLARTRRCDRRSPAATPATCKREADLATAHELLADPDMAEMAQEEIASAEAELLAAGRRVAAPAAAQRPGRRTQRLHGNPRRHRRR